MPVCFVRVFFVLACGAATVNGECTPDHLAKIQSCFVDLGHQLTPEALVVQYIDNLDTACAPPGRHFIELANGTNSNNIALKRGDANVTFVDKEGQHAIATLKGALHIHCYRLDIFPVQTATERGACVYFQLNSAELVYKDGTKFNIEKTGDSVVIKGAECLKSIMEACKDEERLVHMARLLNINGIKPAVKDICENRAVIEKHAECIKQQDASHTTECTKPIGDDAAKMSSDNKLPSEDEMCGLFSRYEACHVDLYEHCGADVTKIFKRTFDLTIPAYCGGSVANVSLLLLILFPIMSIFFK